MNRKQKEQIINAVQSIYGKYATLRFRTADDTNQSAEGFFLSSKKEIVIKSTTTASTLAHEVAHAIQYAAMGATDCDSTRNRKSHNSELSWQHSLIQNNVEIQLSNNGVEELWNTATNTYPRVTKANIGRELAVIPK